MCGGEGGLLLVQYTLMCGGEGGLLLVAVSTAHTDVWW